MKSGFLFLIAVTGLLAGCGLFAEKEASAGGFKIIQTEGSDFKLDPFDVSGFGRVPLAAGIKFTWTGSGALAAEVSIYGRDEEDEILSGTYTFGSAPENTVRYIPVLGLYPGFSNTVKLKVSAGGETLHNKTYTIQTPELPDYLEAALGSSVNGTYEGGEMILAAYRISGRAVGGYTLAAFDKRGNIRYYTKYTSADTVYMHTFLDGKIFIGQKAAPYKLKIYSLLGEQLDFYDYSNSGFGYIHHGLIKLWNNTYALTVNPADGNMGTGNDSRAEEDVIIIENGSFDAHFDLGQFFPNVNDLFTPVLSDLTYYGAGIYDWIHNNSLAYARVGDGGALIFSSQRGGIFAATLMKQPLWYFYPHKVLTPPEGSEKRRPADGSFPALDYSQEPSYERLLLTPLNSGGSIIEDADIVTKGYYSADFSYPFRQHGLAVVSSDENGINLLVLDNGITRAFGDGGTLQPNRSRAVEYRIDFDADSAFPGDGYGGTVKQVWEWLLPDAYGRVSPVGGTSSITSSGNYIFTFGSINALVDNAPVKAEIVELSQTGTEVFRLTLPASGNVLGETPQEVAAGGGAPYLSVYSADKIRLLGDAQ